MKLEVELFAGPLGGFVCAGVGARGLLQQPRRNRGAAAGILGPLILEVCHQQRVGHDRRDIWQRRFEAYGDHAGAAYSPRAVSGVGILDQLLARR